MSEAEQGSALFHICPSPTEVLAMAREVGVTLHEGELETVDWLVNKTLVVKHCADWTVLREFLLKVKKEGFEPGDLLEKCHLVLQCGLKEVVGAAVEAIKAAEKTKLTKLARTMSCRNVPSEEHLSPESALKQEKQYARLRIALLPCKTEDNSSEDSQTKGPSQGEGSKLSSPLCNETAETRHILATRSQFYRNSIAIPPKPLATVRLRHKHETPPTTERAQTLLRNFLATERRIAAVKDAERVSAKSARHTPKAVWIRTNTAAGYRHRSTLSLGSVKTTLQF